MTRLSTNLLVAGFMIGAALLLTTGRKLGVIDGDTVMRIYMAGMGLYVAASANLIPKAAGPISARCLAVRRVAGWTLVSGGLAYMAAGLFAPPSIAPALSAGLLLVAVLAATGYCLWGRAPKAV